MFEVAHVLNGSADVKRNVCREAGHYVLQYTIQHLFCCELQFDEKKFRHMVRGLALLIFINHWGKDMQD